jgi:AraC-like DNA-binding protein
MIELNNLEEAVFPTYVNRTEQAKRSESIVLKHKRFSAGDRLCSCITTRSYFLLMEEGKFMTFCEDKANPILTGNGLMCIPASMEISGEFLEDSSMLIISLPAQYKTENAWLAEIVHRMAMLTPNIYNCTQHETLAAYTRATGLMIDSGMDTIRFNTLKMDEFTMLVRHNYSPEEAAHIFLPLLGSDIKFRTDVLHLYKIKPDKEYIMRESGMCRTIFYRNFKEEFHTTINRWLLQKKSKVLLKYLTETEMSLQEIATKMEFSSVNELTRFCQRELGEGPLKVRNNYLINYALEQIKHMNS